MDTKTTQTTTQTKASAKKPGPKSKATAAAKESAPAKKAAPKPSRLDDHVLISVRSNQYGGLVFVNSRTHERVTWDGVNDVQELSVADIRDMRATARRFFEEPWVEIEEIITPGYEEMTHEDILASLALTKYYDKSKRPSFLSDALDWDIETIREKVPSMTRDTRDNLSIAVADAVRTGEMNALNLIRVWEEVLGVPLLDTAE